MDASKLAESGNTISQETAESEVLSLFEFYDVEIEENDPIVKKLTKAAKAGRIQMFENEDGLCVRQILSRPTGERKMFEYGVVCGKTKLAMKNIPASDPYSQMFAMLGALAGVKPAEFMQVKGPDFATCEALAMVFFKG